MARAVDALLHAGYGAEDLGLYLLIGFPGHSPARATREAAELSGLGPRVHVNLYSPVPGTPDFRRACREAQVDLAGEPLWHNTSLLPYWSRTFSSRVVDEVREAAAAGQARAAD